MRSDMIEPGLASEKHREGFEDQAKETANSTTDNIELGLAFERRTEGETRGQRISTNPEDAIGLRHVLPPVDRGKDAWLVLTSAFVLEALVWGKSPFQTCIHGSRAYPVWHLCLFSPIQFKLTDKLCSLARISICFRRLSRVLFQRLSVLPQRL